MTGLFAKKPTQKVKSVNTSDLFTLQIACNGLLNICCGFEVAVCSCLYPFRFVNCKDNNNRYKYKEKHVI